MRTLGHFLLFMQKLFVNRERLAVYASRFFEECIKIGVGSLFIVVVVSFFIGAVTTLQTAYNLVSPLVPLYIIATIVRDMSILELAPTFTAIVFAGKVGSNIAGEIGTMRITEQIDALEIMGINSASYLVLPKVLAGLFTYPFLVILAGAISIYAGFLTGTLGGHLTAEDYIYGIRIDFRAFNVFFALLKSYVFALLITAISAYKGFYVRGGALEVGKASTGAVTSSCIAVLIADFLLAQMLV